MLEVMVDEIAHFTASLIQKGLDFYHFNIKKGEYDDRWHYVMEFNAGKFIIQYLSHQSYIQKMSEQVAIIYHYLDPENFIRITLGMCKHCNSLVFDCEDDGLFIQFWLADGNLMCSLPNQRN